MVHNHHVLPVQTTRITDKYSARKLKPPRSKNKSMKRTYDVCISNNEIIIMKNT